MNMSRQAQATSPLPAFSTSTRHDDLCWSVVSSRARVQAMEAWKELETRLRLRGDVAVPLACSVAWVQPWLTTYGAAVPHEFLVARRNGITVGIALMTFGVGQKEGPIRVRTRHLGTAGERPGESACVEYNGILIEPECRGTFEEALVSHILGDKSWESFCLDGFPLEDAQRMLQDIPGATLRVRDSHYHDLRETREQGGDVIDRLGRSTRQNLRRQLRSLGEVDVEWAESESEAMSIFDELVTLHQARWMSAGEKGAFASPRFLAFQKSLMEEAFASNTVHPSYGQLGDIRRSVVLVRVRRCSETIGCLMLLVDGNRMLDYLSGFAPFTDKMSPGVITHVLAMQEGVRRGFDAYDFLVGEKRHKSNLSTHSHSLVWAKWSRPSLKNGMIDFFRNLKQRVRDFRQPQATTHPVGPAR
ncbi:MAG: GNAT family N-acetyltransferase [Planctomycetaceae bacterium]